MVKIEFEVPEWAIGRHIHIMAGVELLGQMEFRREKNRINGNVEIKEYYLPLRLKPENGRCSGCSDCCNSGGPRVLIEKLGLPYQKDRPCPMLNKDGCSLGSAIPFSCASSNCEGWSENCTEKLIELEVR